uniref:Uncharacterized protein n=1 Tax=Serinus canaria TaxID=9135 RepID=A0A8C9U335_SERCA
MPEECFCIKSQSLTIPLGLWSRSDQNSLFSCTSFLPGLQTNICPLLPCSHLTLNNLHLSLWCMLQRYRRRYFRVSCPLNAGSISLGLRRSCTVILLNSVLKLYKNEKGSVVK